VIVKDWKCVIMCTIQKHSCHRDKQCNCSCQGTSEEAEKFLVGTLWLMCCATIRKVAGSIPAGVSGVFIDIKSF